jgi:hypothetical protein
MFERFTAWRRRRRQERREALLPERKIVVSFDESGISAAFPEGPALAIAWSEVERVAIETNDSGPWGADFWWLLEGEAKRCAYPQGATGELEAMAAFPSRFPGFSHTAVISANCSTSNARFLCWERGKAL